MHRIEDTLTQVKSRINATAEQYGRNAHDVTLLGVSKKQSAEKIREAHAAGLKQFGENYLQEALEKQAELTDLNLCWHFIGPIQSNKTRQIAAHFDWVHSIDRAKIAQRLNDQRPHDKPPLNICLQINIDLEESKQGIAPEDAVTFAEQIHSLDRLQLRGLMVIPEPKNSIAAQRKSFQRTHALKQKIEQRLNKKLDTLSMGMSSDLEAAIAEGATIVRIGTALFGQRL